MRVSVAVFNRTRSQAYVSAAWNMFSKEKRITHVAPKSDQIIIGNVLSDSFRNFERKGTSGGTYDLAVQKSPLRSI
jgi:hypothetical protein